MKHLLHKEVERHFRSEFINRLDDIIVFKTLSKVDLETIVDYELRKVRQRLGEHHLALELTNEAKTFLINKGYNPDFGARPLRRAIEHNIEDPSSEDILRGNYRGKTKISVSVKKAATPDEKDQLYFEGAADTPAESGTELEKVHEGT